MDQQLNLPGGGEYGRGARREGPSPIKRPTWLYALIWLCVVSTVVVGVVMKVFGW